MEFKIVTKIEEARDIWNKLSPHKTIDDEWDFRYAFYKYLPYKLNFIVGYDNEEPIGLLPLQKDNLSGLMPPYYKKDNKPFLEFFGGDDMDDNMLLTKPGYEDSLPIFLSQLSLPTYLAPLAKQYLSSEFYTYKYFINLSTFKTHEDFIDATWQGDSRGKFKRGIRSLHKKHKIEIIENDLEDINLLSDLNTQRFGKSSSFNFPYRKEIFFDLAKLYETQIITIKADGVRQAVSYGIYYKKTYISMNIGVNPEINNLGKLIIMLQIDKAILKDCSSYDAGKGDSGWKEVYKLQKSPQFKLELHV